MSEVSENIQQRYEQKFVFKQKHSAYVEQIVKAHPAHFQEIFQQRQINNIYLDDSEFNFYHDHKRETAERKKVRIRWYGDTFGKVVKPVLEIKNRNGELRIKKSYRLPVFTFEKGFNSISLQELFTRASLPLNVFDEMEALEPRLLNRYSRKYYRSSDLYFRFTIDNTLEYFDFFRSQNSFLQQEMDNDHIILELKFDVAFVLEVASINSVLPAQDKVFSKYVSGMEKVCSHLI